MKILLINPAFYDGKEFRNRFDDYIDWIKGGNLYVAPFEPPIGLAFLSAYLKERGHEVTLLDMQGLLMDSEALAGQIAARQPDLVGITAMTPTVPEALQAAAIAKRVSLKSKVVLGGVHPTLDPAGVLADENVDFVIRGEGEEAFAALATALADGNPVDGIPGLSFRRDGKPVIGDKATLIADLNTLPMPDYEAFPVERYIEHNQHLRSIRGISMIVSRGCPFQCTFCAVHQTMGRKWRIKSPERVVDELLILKERHQLEGVWFKDSIFNLDREWVKEFCRLMIERKVEIAWQALTRIDLIDEEELRLMKRAGLTQLDLGIETGSPKSLLRLKKGITVDRIREKVRLAKKHVKVFGFFMIGIPGEDETDVQQTFELAKALDLDRWTWSIYSPLPGSSLYEELIAEGKIEPYRLDYHQVHFTEAYAGICDIPPLRLKELYREINEYFYRKDSPVQAAG
ncbi:MAG: B12-binding domain-containing radical SAM protein [Geobacter sp.]|nr:B12-binding domain-containing radical SAM protein [Geobacter sp.]